VAEGRKVQKREVQKNAERGQVRTHLTVRSEPIGKLSRCRVVPELLLAGWSITCSILPWRGAVAWEREPIHTFEVFQIYGSVSVREHVADS
jgi:hypothetical protein